MKLQITLCQQICTASQKNSVSRNIQVTLCQQIRTASQKNSVSRNILQLRDRGLFKEIVNSNNVIRLSNHLENRVSVYCGFDPTADSLHIGNLLAINALIHCQRSGHKPICLIGGATAAIGDPSGTTKERIALKKDIISNNVRSIQSSIERIFQNHKEIFWSDRQKELKPLKILNNLDWYSNRNVIEFMSVIGRHFKMGDMLDRDSVKLRLNSSGGMNFPEFTYQIFQAYDWLHLLMDHDCAIQIGGNDQLGNIQAGFDLIRKVKTEDAWGLTLPLVTNSSGVKLGKSADNSLWLNPDKTSPYTLYQYFVNKPDQEVESLLKLMTFRTLKGIQDLIVNHREQPEKRLAQKELAKDVVKLIHGENGYELAKKCTQIIFHGSEKDLAELTQEQTISLFEGAETVSLTYEVDMTVMEMCMKVKAFRNQKEALAHFADGAVRINMKREYQSNFLLVKGQHILPNDITLIGIGKRRHIIVKWHSL